jgi:hypothetical protein
LTFHQNGAPRGCLAREHIVAGQRHERGTLLRFDRDGRLIYAQQYSC